jgi:hypothetical protein
MASIVPLVASPPITPFTCHVTAVFEVLDTVAVNVWGVETDTAILVGMIVIVTC